MKSKVEPRTFIKAPLRNRLRLELTASTPEVWALVGNLARMSDYSAGLERVEAEATADGRCTGYTCYFKPMQPGEEAIVSSDTMVWYEPNAGWASHSASGDAFGLTDDLHLVTLEPSTGGVLLTWDAYFQAEDLAEMMAHLYEAHSDIGQNLLNQFGGRLVHCYACN